MTTTNTYTCNQAAAYLGVHPVTLRKWERDGHIAAQDRTLGGHRRYSQATLDALKRRREVAPLSGKTVV